MINKQPKSSQNLENISSTEDVFEKNQEIFQKGQKSFKEAKSYDNQGFENDQSDSEFEEKGSFLKRLSSKNSRSGYRQVSQKDDEDQKSLVEDKRQDEDCCGDCNSLTCPHCDCTFW